ncbi:MAG: phosphatidate cytidylyltransferase [Gammaproteobacteria bacterium]|nr:phosphatidate cytidylyltransferase [Gammaproteobacteria bacterium]
MLKQRLLTIAVLLPLFVWCVLALPTKYFALCLALMVLVGAWEWAGLIGLTGRGERLAYLVIVGAVLGGAAWSVSIPWLRQSVLTGAVVWWCVAMVWIRRYNHDPHGFPRSLQPDPARNFPPRGLFGMLGVVVLAPAWLGLVILHGNAFAGGHLVLLLMLLVWGADSGAYAAGRLWGRTKLAPEVSPGKSWEGVYGGLAVAMLMALGSGLWFGLDWRALVTLTLLGIVTVLFSIIGDLFESMIKRLAGVKDSGRLLPGHGGMLDRIDSVTAAAPVFALGLIWQGVVA